MISENIEYFIFKTNSAWSFNAGLELEQWRRQGGARGGGRPPPNVFQSVVLDSFKYDELRRRGVGKLSADSVVYLACIYS